MQVTELHHETTFTIGGGHGWVRDQVKIAADRMRGALETLKQVPNWVPGVEPHPHEAALNAARESVLHLSEILHVEAPRDAVEETRHALEALQGAVSHLERIPVGSADLQMPGVGFERAIGFLERVELRLADENMRMPDGSTDANNGIVPPWMQDGAMPATPDQGFLPLPGPRELLGTEAFVPEPGPRMQGFVPEPGPRMQTFVPEPGPNVFIPEPGPEVFVPEPGPNVFMPEPGPN